MARGTGRVLGGPRVGWPQNALLVVALRGCKLLPCPVSIQTAPASRGPVGTLAEPRDWNLAEKRHRSSLSQELLELGRGPGWGRVLVLKGEGPRCWMGWGHGAGWGGAMVLDGDGAMVLDGVVPLPATSAAASSLQCPLGCCPPTRHHGATSSGITILPHQHHSLASRAMAPDSGHCLTGCECARGLLHHTRRRGTLGFTR